LGNVAELRTAKERNNLPDYSENSGISIWKP
jgi:hypothetical protein